MRNRGFDVVSKIELSDNGIYIRVNVSDLTKALSDVFKSLVDTCWINRFFCDKDWLRISILERAMPTIEAIREDFNNGVNPQVNKDTGEKLVSEISRRTLIEDYNYVNIPLAELYKQKVDGNPGFDFHSISPNECILLFGEAKYNSQTTAYDSALTQISNFISEKKDMKDLSELRDYVSEDILNNATKGAKGYIAAFSAKKTKDEVIINKIKNHEEYQKITTYSSFIVIAVEI